MAEEEIGGDEVAQGGGGQVQQCCPAAAGVAEGVGLGAEGAEQVDLNFGQEAVRSRAGIRESIQKSHLNHKLKAFGTLLFLER